MQFELGCEHAAAVHDRAVLLGDPPSQVTREDLFGRAPQELTLAFAAGALDEGLIDRSVATIAILEKVDRVGNGIEQAVAVKGLRQGPSERGRTVHATSYRPQPCRFPSSDWS